MKSRYVCAFNDRSTVSTELLGQKGALLAEMSQSGIPIPAGFTVTTDSCGRYYDDSKIICSEVSDLIKENVSRLEILTGKTFGKGENPLLLSVRTGSRQSVPGLMETILHLGMNDAVAEALSVRMSDPRSAYEYYLQFLRVYSNMVKRFGKKQYTSITEDYIVSAGKTKETELSLTELKELVSLYKQSYRKNLNEDFPSDPVVQLLSAVSAGFHYWDSPRANYYRMVKEIPYSWGAAVTVQTMVYGNLSGERSGTGVAFTRNPSDGKKERLGEFLMDSRTGDILSSSRAPVKLSVLSDVMPDVYEEFERDCFLIENKYRDIFEINFTIEDGNFFIIKTRKAKRTALAAFTAACDFADEGICSEKDAIKVLDPLNISALRPNHSFDMLLEDTLTNINDFEKESIVSADDYKPDENTAEYKTETRVNNTQASPDSTAVSDNADDSYEDTENTESNGGIYNNSLFDYELDDIMTEIYSGFNVYDEDNDDSSLTDELKRLVSDRIPPIPEVPAIPQTVLSDEEAAKSLLIDSLTPDDEEIPITDINDIAIAKPRKIKVIPVNKRR